MPSFKRLFKHINRGIQKEVIVPALMGLEVRPPQTAHPPKRNAWAPASTVRPRQPAAVANCRLPLNPP